MDYPPEILTGAMLEKFAVQGWELRIPAQECDFAGHFNFHGERKEIFGGALKLSERLAAEKEKIT